MQDSSQLEEQLLPFDGALILWFAAGFILAFSFYVHSLHTFMLLAWSGRYLSSQASPSFRILVPKVRQNSQKDPFACHQYKSEQLRC